MSFIQINDVFDELIDENKRLRECLKVLIEFKNFVDLVFNKLDSNLDLNESNKYKELNRTVEQVFKTNNLVKCLNDLRVLKEDKSKINETKNKSVNNCVNKNSRNDKTLNMNINSDVNSDEQATVSDVPWTKVNDVYICGFIGCGKEYTSKSSFDYHLSSHHKRFVCDFEGCHYRTGYMKAFRTHSNKHKKIKPFNCKICLKTFSSKSNVNYHMKSSHSTENPIICGIDKCVKVFRNEFQLIVHQKAHKEKRFSCDYPNCDFKCSEKSYIKIHKIRHSEERPFICDFDGCGMAFKTKHTLNNHKRLHIPTDETFICEYEGCGKSFRTKALRLIHSSVIHSNVKHRCEWPGCDFETKNPRTLHRHKLIHSTHRKFHCEWPECGKSFKAKTDLNLHLRIHNNERRYACSWPGCQYRCVFGGNLRKHMRVHQK